MEKGFGEKLKNVLKYHLHIILYTYFWFGLFVCGLAAPQARIDELHSSFITSGWRLSALSLVLVLPVPIIYWIRMRGGEKGD